MPELFLRGPLHLDGQLQRLAKAERSQRLSNNLGIAHHENGEPGGIEIARRPWHYNPLAGTGTASSS